LPGLLSETVRLAEPLVDVGPVPNERAAPLPTFALELKDGPGELGVAFQPGVHDLRALHTGTTSDLDRADELVDVDASSHGTAPWLEPPREIVLKPLAFPWGE
jgi:hypothetical protein